MLAEMEILSKVHVHEEVMKGSTNILHTDGTKYKFNEIGGFQVSTGSGSFTLGIEPMQSGEAETYFSIFKYLLEDMSSLVVPEDQVDDNVKKILFIFKGLMTDRTIMNSSFFKKFQHWREQIIPFVVENFSMLPNAEKEKISNIHHAFCGLHVIHNLGTYAEKAINEWEKIIEEQGNMHGGFKGTQKKL